MTPETNITGPIRVSILERLVPVFAFSVAAISGAVGGFMLWRFLDEMRSAETAGYYSFFTGAFQIEFAMGIILAIAVALGAIGILVSVIRMFTSNTTASPPGVLFLILGLLSVVAPFAMHFAIHMMKGAVIDTTEGGVSSVAGTLTALSTFALIFGPLMVLVFLASAFIPFTSRAGRKFSTFICLVIVELILLALAAVFFWEAKNSVTERNPRTASDYVVPESTPTTNSSSGTVPGGVPDYNSNIATDTTVSNTSSKTISGGVLNGKATSLPQPSYPPAARAAKASGSVSVQVLVDENGNVVSAAAVSGHPLLRASAVQAARQARFAPTKLSGKTVRVAGVIIYNFVAE